MLFPFPSPDHLCLPGTLPNDACTVFLVCYFWFGEQGKRFGSWEDVFPDTEAGGAGGGSGGAAAAGQGLGEQQTDSGDDDDDESFKVGYTYVGHI